MYVCAISAVDDGARDLLNPPPPVSFCFQILNLIKCSNATFS